MNKRLIADDLIKTEYAVRYYPDPPHKFPIMLVIVDHDTDPDKRVGEVCNPFYKAKDYSDAELAAECVANRQRAALLQLHGVEIKLRLMGMVFWAVEGRKYAQNAKRAEHPDREQAEIELLKLIYEQ